MPEKTITDFELLERILQKPIAFHQIFYDLTGDIKSALFLSQIYYWSKIMKHEWFYKTSESWSEETRLSWEEQSRIRKKLKALELIEEKRKGVPAKLYFRFNFGRFIELARQHYSQIQGFPETEPTLINRQIQGLPESGKPGNKNQTFPESITENKTENTKKENISTKVEIQKKKRLTSIPEDFGLSASLIDWGEKNGYDAPTLEKHLVNFKEVCEMKNYQYANWNLAFQRAVRDNWAKLQNKGKPVAPEDDFSWLDG